MFVFSTFYSELIKSAVIPLLIFDAVNMQVFIGVVSRVEIVSESFNSKVRVLAEACFTQQVG